METIETFAHCATRGRKLRSWNKRELVACSLTFQELTLQWASKLGQLLLESLKSLNFYPHFWFCVHVNIAICYKVVADVREISRCDLCLGRRPFMQSPGVDMLALLSFCSQLLRPPAPLPLLILPHAERNSANFNVRACVRGACTHEREKKRSRSGALLLLLVVFFSAKNLALAQSNFLPLHYTIITFIITSKPTGWSVISKSELLCSYNEFTATAMQTYSKLSGILAQRRALNINDLENFGKIHMANMMPETSSLVWCDSILLQFWWIFAQL